MHNRVPACLQVDLVQGKLVVVQEGRHSKFVERVSELTFSAATAPPVQEVLYVTERAVLRLRRAAGAGTAGGGSGADGSSGAGRSGSSSSSTWLELVEVAPGIDVQRQVLDLMAFRPQVPASGPAAMGPVHTWC